MSQNHNGQLNRTDSSFERNYSHKVNFHEFMTQQKLLEFRFF